MARTLYYKGIQLPQLRSFCSVALEGSFTAAARALGLSKATVWQQVRALERELGVTLLSQLGRRVELTSEGRLLLKLIQPHVSGLDSLVRLFETQRAELEQSLTVAATPYLIAHHLPGPIQEFTARNPSVRLQLRTDLWTEEAMRLLDQGQADLGFVPYLPDEPRNPYLDYEDLFNLTFSLLMPEGHPLVKKKQVRPEDLVQYPIIKGASYNHRALEAVLRRHNLFERMHVVLESGSTDIIRRYVALGVGIALIYMGREPHWPPPDVRVRPFNDETQDLRVAILTRKGAHLPEHVQDFCRTIRRFHSEHRPLGRRR